MKSKTRKAAGKASLDPLVRLFRSCKTIRNAIFQDCMGKSHCSPMETDLNPDYHVEVTFTIAEIREFCFAARDAEHARKPNAEAHGRAKARTVQPLVGASGGSDAT